MFHVPNTYTGIGDWGGADAMVTMGGFDDAAGLPVGTDNQQAGTIMHELGHTMMLTHGGAPGNANCGPNRVSVMNYLFQLRGLPRANGDLTGDYSGQALGALDESSLFETDGIGPAPYRTSWYAPFVGVGTQATRHCNGTVIGPLEPPMVRVGGTTIGGSIDWNTDGNSDDPVPPVTPEFNGLDINFDGVLNDASAPLEGYDDWANLRLNQVGSRRNIGIWYFADEFPYIGPASLDMGRFDFGRFDFGDLNTGDLGRFDFGRFDFGVGAGDLGRGSDGKGGFGRFDFGRFDFGGGADGELTIDLAVAAGLLGPPTDFTVCVGGDVGNPDACVPDPGGGPSVVLTWGAPDASPTTYALYRSDDGGATFVLVGTVDPAAGVDGAFAFTDATVVRGTTYTFYATARYVSGTEVNESATDTDDVTINVVDITAPVVTAPASITVEAEGALTPAATAVIAVFLSSATVVDVIDGDLSAAVAHDAPPAFPLGPTVVTFSATDAALNTGAADATVTVVDTTAPALTAPGAVTVEATGPATVVALGTPTVSDAVDASPVVTNDAPATFPLGPTTVTWTVTDASGNVNTAAQLVTVEDTTAPALTAPGAVTVEATGPATVVALGTPTVSDAVDASPVVTNDAPATFPLGPTTVTDASGNVNTAAQLVTVEDTTAPALTAPGAVTVEATGPATVVALGTPTVSDAVDASPVVTNDAPATFPLGPTTVTWTVTDASGNVNTAAQLVTVEDTTAPALTAPGAVTVEATGPATVVALGTPTVSDAVDASPVVTNDAPATFPLGPTTVTWTVTDASGNVNTAAQLVTVEDTTAPALTAPGAVTVEATGPATVVALGTPTVSDAVDASPVVTNDAPATFPLGPTTVTWTVTDASGNVNTAAQLVTVEDTTAPALTAPGAVTVEATGPATVVALGTPTVSDAVDASPVVTNDAPATFPLGPTTVTWTVTDASGNVNTAAQLVTVEDTTAPAVTAPASITVEAESPLTPATTTTIATFLAAAIAGDTVDGDLTLAVVTNAPAEFPLGPTVVTFSATDAALNTGTADATVTVVDTTAPVTTATLQGSSQNGWFIGPVTVTLAATDSASAIADTSCFIDGTECGASPFVVTAEGIHTIQFWSTDTAGVVEAAQTVEVRVDATAPLVSASANPPTLWPPNNEFIPVTVSGVITDSLSGPLTGPGVATYSVADEYGQIEPTGPVTINPDGSYAVEILLRASRRGNDSDGRLYTIFIAATDLAGNLPGVDTSTSVNVHDQGQ